MQPNKRKVLVTGGGTFLGDYIAAALLVEGAEVTLLVRPGAEDKVGPLSQRARIITADVWDPASLRGRARGHACVINTVGSMTADPVQGLTHHRLNFVSARNVTNMVISDGVPHTILMSAARAPWVSRQYVAAKREAEEYVRRVGVSTTVIRAPLVYQRGVPRPLFFEVMTLLGTHPPLQWTPLGTIAPLAIDILARAVARIALNPKTGKAIYFAPDLRRLNTREELARGVPLKYPVLENDATQPNRKGLSLPDDDTPFGWLPGQRK